MNIIKDENIKIASCKVLKVFESVSGWCCCCCPCSCCHPYSVLHEAKEFLAQNPPGVAQLYSKRKIFYDPSEFEKMCYKELENEVFNF